MSRWEKNYDSFFFFFPVPVARETNSLKYFLMSEKEAVMFPFPRKKPEMVCVLW